MVSIWPCFTSLLTADALVPDERGPLAVAITHRLESPTNDDHHSNPGSMMSTSHSYLSATARTMESIWEDSTIV